MAKPFYLPKEIRNALDLGGQKEIIATWLGTLGSNAEQGLDAASAYYRSRYAAQQKISGFEAATQRNAKIFREIATRGVFATYYLTADVGEVQNQLSQYADEMQRSVYTKAAPEYMRQANNILLDIVTEYGSVQNEGAFPKEYLADLQTKIRLMPPPILSGNKPSFTYVQQTDIFNYLGDYGDFVKGWHYNALLYEAGKAYSYDTLSQGPRVKLPWLGGPDPDSSLLWSDTARKRYGYFHALQEGKKFYVVYPEALASYSVRFSHLNGGSLQEIRHSQPVEIPIVGSWSDTIAARLTAWAPKAPQWLLLEYGQFKWKPTITGLPKRTKPQIEGLAPGAVTQEWINRCATLWQTLVEDAWNSATIQTQRLHAHAAGAVTLRGEGANARWHTLITRTIGGRPYAAGSIIPTSYAINGPAIRAVEQTFRKDIQLAREAQIKADQLMRESFRQKYNKVFYGRGPGEIERPR